MGEIEEIWVVSEDYPFIEVSNQGRVRKKDTYRKVPSSHPGVMMVRHDKAKMLSLLDHGNGYLYVSINEYGKTKNEYVHRLVAKAFVEGFKEGLVVDHINHDRSDNRADNLEWVTQKENVRRSAHLMKGQREKCRPTNTGEKYISYTRCKGHMRYKVYGSRYFRTLEEAIKHRNEVMGW